MDDIQKQALNDYVDSLGLSYSARFVPQSLSRNAKEKPCLNWKITFGKGTHSSMQLEVDYMQGIGHLKHYVDRFNNIQVYNNAVKAACETGKSSLIKPAKNAFDSIASTFQKLAIIPTPEKTDVLYSLVSDCDVRNYPNFEEWASDLGYDVDSRSAEKIYDACMKTYLQLKSMIGEIGIDKLQELYQDY
jgi:hypothetical protein